MMVNFKKGAHVSIIKTVAQGLADAGVLRNYLELGTQRGTCFNSVAPLVDGYAYAVEVNPDGYGYIKSNQNLKWYNCTTDEFFKNIGDIRFDMIFIDADHSHESSMKDFENASNHIKNNGLILLHDTYPMDEKYTSKSYCFDTYKTAWKIRKEWGNNFESMTLPFYYGVTIVRKCSKQLDWMK